jgi:PAS domain S-box-containing protein
LPEQNETSSTSQPDFFEENLEDLYENAPCGYVSTFPDGSFAKVNQTFLRWTGYQRHELLGGKRFQEMLTVAGRIFYETHVAPLLQMQGFVNEIAFDLLCRDGQRLPALISTVQKRDPSGAAILNRTTIFNASDRRQYERELQLARKKAEEALALRDQFLSLASHELKTPLTSLLGHIELLQRRVSKENSLNPRDQRTLQIIADQTQRLHKMIISLLDISRIERGQLMIEPAAIDICALVRRVVDEVQATLVDRRIVMLCMDQPLMIHGDDLRLEQALQNLLQNALKYSPEHTAIGVVVRQDQVRVYIDVHDRGIGIPQAALSHIFDRFYRAGNVDMSAVSGLGIGLYVVKQIVELHGGEVIVESTEGAGSTFTIALPLDGVPDGSVELAR